MSKKNILIICPFFSPNIGGVETHLNDLVGGLLKRGFKVDVLTYQPLTTNARGLKIDKKRDLTIYRINWFGQTLFHKLEKYPILQFVYLFPGLFVNSFIFIIKHKERIDLIHAHGLIAACIARIITLFFPKKKIFSIHAIYNFKQRKTLGFLVKWILKDFDCSLALANYSLKDLAATGLAKNKIKVVYQWVNKSIFKPQDKKILRKKLKLKDKFSVLFVGRLIDIKGAGLLLKVAKKLPQVNFLFIGQGPEEDKLKQNLRLNNLKNAFLLGKKTQLEIADYYAACDLVAVPSLYEEGFSRVILEALSCARPVLASNKGCLPEMINRAGVLISPNEKNFKNTIIDLLKNKKRLNDLSQAAFSLANNKYSAKNINKIIALYE